MTKSFLDVGVDWEGAAYRGGSFSEADARTADTKDPEGWLLWQSILERAKRGDFEQVAKLIEVYERHGDWVLAAACESLLGDAGNLDCLRLMAKTLEAAHDPIVDLMMKVDFADALARSGRLEFVPVVLRAYTAAHTFGDAHVLPFALSEMLESEPDRYCEPAEYPSLDAYAAAILEQATALEQRFGKDAYVCGGEIYDVRRIASELHRKLVDGPEIGLAQRFAASTGVDISRFYKGRVFNYLTAASIIEEFLESAEAKRYHPGLRYFFGHRID